MIIDYDHNQNLNTDRKLDSLKESVQMALNENDTDHRGFRALFDKANATIDSIKESVTKILTDLRSLEIVRVSASYSNVVIPSSEYVKISSFATLGVPTSYYFLCGRIKGWQGTTVYSVITSSGGTDFYITGKAGTLTSVGIDYYFAKKVSSI